MPTRCSLPRTFIAGRFIGAIATTGRWRWSHRAWAGHSCRPTRSSTDGVAGLPLVELEFWREVNLVSVRGRQYSTPVGALVREVTAIKWFGNDALSVSRTPKMKLRA